MPGPHLRRFSAAPWAPRLWPILCALAVLAIFAARIIGRAAHGGLWVEDDAYYYLVIARNIAQTGMSSFDHQSLTNGYHPLWLAVLVAQDLTTGPSLWVTLGIEALLVAAALYLILRSAAAHGPPAAAAFSLVFVALVSRFCLKGMEVSLLIFCVGLLVWALERAQRGADRPGLWLGLAAAACIGARIDAAVFVLPALVLAPIARRTRGLALGIIAGLGLVYAAYNEAMFGVLTPISSAVKSLGGLQLNHRLLSQLAFALGPHHPNAIILVTALMLAASPLLIGLSRPKSLARTLAWASSLGGLAYAIKLILLSSWAVWPWYGFALMFPLVAGFYALAPLAEPAIDRLGRRLGPGLGGAGALAVGGLGLGLALVLAARGLAGVGQQDEGFGRFNRVFAQRYAGVLGGARLAMGDRAGSFADAYPGGVVQLEGLVNDKAYLAALKRGGDLGGLLCARRVRYLVAYEPDLGAYDAVQVTPLRPGLTQFKGPWLTARRADEVGHVSGQAYFDPVRDQGVSDTSLYLWRLRCGG